MKLIEIPKTRQATGYTCGVAAVQSVLCYNGVDRRQDELEKELKSGPEHGTNNREMIRVLNDCGLKNEMRHNMEIDDIIKTVDGGGVVICLIQAWHGEKNHDYADEWEDGHYVVAVGYDDERIYFMDPSTIDNYTYIEKDELLKRWHDYDEDQRYYNAGIVIENTPKYNSRAFLKMW